MTCSRIEKLLPLYVGGDLPERKARAVAQHLAACPNCRRTADAYAASVEALRDAGAQTPPGQDWRACWRAVDARLVDNLRRRRVTLLPASFDAGRLARAAAMFLLALGLGILVGWHLKSRTDRAAPGRVEVAVPAPPQAVEVAEEQGSEPSAPDAEAAVAKRKQGPARKLFVIDELVSPGLVFDPRATPGSAQQFRRVGARTPRYGYYMDNIQLIGEHRRR